jgi:hypothetical protein
MGGASLFKLGNVWEALRLRGNLWSALQIQMLATMLNYKSGMWASRNDFLMIAESAASYMPQIFLKFLYGVMD